MAEQAKFNQVVDSAGLDEVFASSNEAPTVLFLDDPYCPVSYEAYREVAGMPISVACVDVSNSRELSRAIERRTGVRHESPQIFVLRNGRAVWSASHLRITAAAIGQALAQQEQAPDGGAQPS